MTFGSSAGQQQQRITRSQRRGGDDEGNGTEKPAMALFSESEHLNHPPESWEVRKRGRMWGVFTAGSDHPMDTFATRREAVEATKRGRLFDLYHKERRWYAGEQIPGWRPFYDLKRIESAVQA